MREHIIRTKNIHHYTTALPGLCSIIAAQVELSLTTTPTTDRGTSLTSTPTTDRRTQSKKSVGIVEKSSSTSDFFTSMKRDDDTDPCLPAAAAICLLNFNLSEGAAAHCLPSPHSRRDQARPQQLLHTMPHEVVSERRDSFLQRKNLTSHFFLLSFSSAPNSFVLVLKSGPGVSTLIAILTPSLLLHS